MFYNNRLQYRTRCTNLPPMPADRDKNGGQGQSSSNKLLVIHFDDSDQIFP